MTPSVHENLHDAYVAVHRSLDCRGHLMARELMWRAADKLRAAGATETATMVEDGLAFSIGHAYNGQDILDRIDSLIQWRAVGQRGGRS